MMRQKVYDRSFFSQLIQYVCMRCDVARHRAPFMREVRPPVSQFELWEALREAVRWLEIRGFLPFRFRLSFEEPSRPLTPSQLEGTICEMAALCTSSPLILYAHTDAAFPSTDYERVMTLVILRTLCKRIFEKQEFGAAFLQLRPDPQEWVVDTVLRGWLAEDRLRAWRLVRGHYSLAAFELMYEALTQSAPGDRQELRAFLRQECVQFGNVQIGKDSLLLLIAQFYACRVVRHGWPITVLPPVSV